MTVTIASDMQFSALRGRENLCVTASYIRLPMIQAFWALQINCILENVYLRSDLSREQAVQGNVNRLKLLKAIPK